MIKRFNKILAGITAAAALLLAAGCKNQLDYLNDTTARNAFNVAGLYVSGLDAGYNGANVALKVVAVNENGDKSDVDYVTGTVADSYKNASGETVGHQSGTVYIKLDEAKLYDGDKMAVDYFNANGDADDYVAFSASSIECYLQVGSDTIKVISNDGSKLENAKLSVPTSEAGTKDADLISRWVTVNVADGVGTFALAGNATEPVNVTLPCISLDLSSVENEAGLPKGVKVNSSSSTNSSVTKITLAITGLEESFVGKTMILSGADIGDTEATIESGNWHYDITSNVMKQNIAKASEDDNSVGIKKDECFVKYTFYGKTQTWRPSSSNIEMIVSDYNGGEGNQDSNNRLLQNSRSMSGGTTDKNFVLPKYLWGKSEVSLTINLAELKKGTDYTQADPEAERSIIYVDGIKIINAPVPSEREYIFSSDGDIAWHNWVPNCGWNNDSYFYTAAGIGSVSKNYGWVFDSPSEIQPNGSIFKLGVQIVEGTEEALDWNSKLGGNAIYTSSLKTEEFAGKHYVFVVDNSTEVSCYLMPASNVSIIDSSDVTLNITSIVLDKALEKVELIGDFNSWEDTGTIKGTVEGNTTKFDVSTNAAEVLKGFKIRSVGSWSGDYNMGLSAGGNIVVSEANATSAGRVTVVNLTYSETTANGDKGGGISKINLK